MSDRMPGVPLDLVERARNGDGDALNALVEAAYPSVRRWSLLTTGDATDADDLTQDVLIRMIRKLDSFQGEAAFSTWLHAVTRNVAADRFRKQARRTRLAVDHGAYSNLVPSRPDDPSSSVERGEVASLLRTLFEELPSRQRQVFDLVELQGVPAGDAAQLLGIEPVTVRAHLFKARRRVRARILEVRPELAEEMP